MSKPERRDDSLFLAARTGDLGGVDVIFRATFDKEIDQRTRCQLFDAVNPLALYWLGTTTAKHCTKLLLDSE